MLLVGCCVFAVDACRGSSLLLVVLCSLRVLGCLYFGVRSSLFVVC